MRHLKTIILLLLVFNKIHGQQFPEPMVPLRLVNDYTGLLTEQQQIELNNKLLKFNNETTTQIFVVAYDELQGFDI
ncbi:MAG: TPM domain-containing protein, partial [Bacteroidales bacterium]|nr:TPM domain-containing protein [Bacteroidales bacterium]